jgi:Bacterial PH domain
MSPVTTTYRQSRKTVLGLAVAILTALVGGGYGVLTGQGVSERDMLIALGLFTVVSGLVIIRFARHATVASPTGLVARGFLWSRRVPWSRVQAIVIEATVSLREQEEHEHAVAYLDTRRRLALPVVNDKNLDALPDAVEALRQQWIAGRGSAWQPIEEVQRVAAHRARRQSALVLAVRWLKIGIGVMAGVWIVLILLKALPPMELRLPIALGFAAVIAIIGMVVETVRARSLPVASADEPSGRVG